MKNRFGLPPLLGTPGLVFVCGESKLTKNPGLQNKLTEHEMERLQL